jgi:hypothetical protein
MGGVHEQQRLPVGENLSGQQSFFGTSAKEGPVEAQAGSRVPSTDGASHAGLLLAVDQRKRAGLLGRNHRLWPRKDLLQRGEEDLGTIEEGHTGGLVGRELAARAKKLWFG